jgi:hypothetical protein
MALPDPDFGPQHDAQPTGLGEIGLGDDLSRRNYFVRTHAGDVAPVLSQNSIVGCREIS